MSKANERHERLVSAKNFGGKPLDAVDIFVVNSDHECAPEPGSVNIRNGKMYVLDSEWPAIRDGLRNHSDVVSR